MHLIKHLVHGLAASLFLLAVALLAQEPSRPTFLFPTAAPAEPGNARRAAARQEGETAMAMHAPELAEEKFTEYCALTPANLPEGGTARRLLAEAQLAHAEVLLNQDKAAATRKFQEALQTVEYYLVLPEIHPTAEERDCLELLRAQALLRLDRADDALKHLMDPERALTANAHENALHWEALRLAARLQLARREWSATLGLLTPYLEAQPPQRRDAELLLLCADAELARGDYTTADRHYAAAQELLAQSPAPAGEPPALTTLAPLRRIRALVGAAGSQAAEERAKRLADALALYRQLAPQRPAPDVRDAEWGTAAWCLANEFARGGEPDSALQLLNDAWNALPYADAHWVETGMLLAQLLHQRKDAQAKEILEQLRVKRPDSPKFGEFSLQLAEYRKEDSDRTRAAEIFAELVQRTDLDAAQRARAAFGAAECLALDGKLDQALNFYRMAAEHAEPRQAVTALLHAADAARNAGNFETAIALQTETADRFGKAPADTEETDEARKLRLRAAEARLEAALLRGRPNTPEALNAAVAMLDAFQQEAPDSPRRAEARLERLMMMTRLAGSSADTLAAVQNDFQQLADDAAVEERLRIIAAFETARLAMRRNDLAAADHALETMLGAFPQSPYALRAAHRRVLLAMQTGNTEAARAQAAQLVEKWPGSTAAAQLTMLLADHALGTATPDGLREALRLYRQVAPPAYTDAAELAQARFEAANCLYLMAQDANPEQFLPPAEPSADTAAAPADPRTQLVEDAIAELAQVPSNAAPALLPDIAMLRGELLALAGHPAEAREQFQRARELAGDAPLGLAALGRIAEMHIAEAGNDDADAKFQTAIDALSYILAHTTDDDLLALAHFRLAQCYRERGRHDTAAKNYEDAIRHFKEICVSYEAAATAERSPRYYTLAVFELAELAEEMDDPLFLEQAAQFLLTYAQHPELPFAKDAAQRADALLQRSRK